MGDASYVREWDEQRISVQASVARGEVWQLSSGEAAYYLRIAGGAETAAGTNDRTDWQTSGKITMPLTAGIEILDGGRCYWDHSANSVSYKRVNDRDFYLGRAVGHGSGGIVVVDLNKDPRPDIDLLRDAALVVPVGTQAIGAFGFPKILGGSQSIELTATNEAQKIDLLSVEGFSKVANAIIDIEWRVPDDGAGTAADFSIGIANGTHSTDADAITEHLLLHMDANATAINVQSKDTSTTVAATDSTKDYVEGSAVANKNYATIDMRTPASVKVYVNGEQVLSGTTFNLDAVAGTLFLLAHLEKSSSTDVYRVVIDRCEARKMEQ